MEDQESLNGSSCDRKPARPHHELNVQMKLALIKEAETNPNMTQKALAKKYGIGKSTVGDILRRQKQRLLEMKMTSELFNVNSDATANSSTPEFYYQQIRQSLIASEKLNNNYSDDDKEGFPNNNNEGDNLNDLQAEEQSYESGGAMNDDDCETDYCPPVKTILHESNSNRSTPPRRCNRYAEPKKRRRLQAEPILFAGFDLRHILTPTQLNKCYSALRLSPRVASNVASSLNPTYCGESDENMEQDVELQDIDESSSEISETETEYSDMSLFDAYELTQHLCNCMKKLLPEGVPYITKCKNLMEKRLGLPTTGHQTKISDYFSPIKPN